MEVNIDNKPGTSRASAQDHEDDFDDDNDPGEVFGYYCPGCGHVQGGPGFGGQCDRCCAYVEEMYE